VNFTFPDVYEIPTLPIFATKIPVTALPAIRIPKTETMRILENHQESSSNPKNSQFSLTLLFISLLISSQNKF
jgi:hypothetical protein